MKAKRSVSWVNRTGAAWALGMCVAAQVVLGAPTQWTALYNRGAPIATYVVGDVLDYQYEFAINTDTAGWGVEYGLGKTADGSDWTWHGADWSRMDGSDNRVWISRPYEHQFTSAGTWYYAGRFLSWDPPYDIYHVATDWAENSGEPLAAESYFTVNELAVPSFVIAMPDFEYPATRAQLGWQQADGKFVMVTMSTEPPTGTPEQGVDYEPNDMFGNQTVLESRLAFNGLDVPGLMPGQTYYFTFYAENFSYYSEGWTETCTMGNPQARNTGGGAPEVPAEVFLGDLGLTFGCDAWGTLEGNWGRARMWASLMPSPSEYDFGEWSDFTSAEHKTGVSPPLAFNTVGTCNWGIQIDYGSPYGDNFWYLGDNGAWYDMNPLLPPYGPTPTVTVLPLSDPTNCVAARSSIAPMSDIDLAWSPDAQGHDVMVMRKLADDGLSWTVPSQGDDWIGPGSTLGSCTIIYKGPFTSFVDTGLAPNSTYEYKFFSMNNGFHSDGAVVRASTLEDYPLISTTSLPMGEEGVPYLAALVATNGTPPFSWSVHAHALGLSTWGRNDCGQTVVPHGLIGVQAVAAGGNHSLALKENGTVVMWGDNGWEQRNMPAGLSNVVAIAAGANHSLALKSDGTVAGWGRNFYGETAVPPGLSNVVAIAGGYFHSLALKSDGTVEVWGLNAGRQMKVPDGLSNVLRIATFNNHNLALRSDGTVVAWGSNTNVPAGLSNVVAIAAGTDHSLALKSDGTVVAWGLNNHGQTTVPASLNNVVALAAGEDFSLALRSDGVVVGWGNDADERSLPPAGLSNVTAIAAGWYHGLALRSTSTLLPAGLTCSPDGVVSGTPTQAGTNLVTFMVQNSAGGCSERTLEIIIAAAPEPAPLLSQTNVNVREGGEGRFFVRLDRAPEGNVVVGVERVGGSSAISIQSGSTRTFKPSNWDTWQVVTLAAPDDANADGETATFRISAPGAADQFVEATALDDDIGANLALAASGTTIAGRNASRAALLIDGIHAVNTNYGHAMCSTTPKGTMTLDLKAIATVSRVRILTWNWVYLGHRYTLESSTDGVTWTPLADATGADRNGWDDWDAGDVELRYLRFTAEATTQSQSALAVAELEVYGTRALPERIEVSKSAVNVREGGEGRFFVRLTQNPGASVPVGLSRTAGGAGITIQSRTNWTFNSANWNVWQPVTLAAAADENADGETATIQIAMAGAAAATVTATALDDEIGENLALASGGATIAGVRANRPGQLIDGVHAVSTNYGSAVWTTVPAGTITLDLQGAQTVSRVRLLNWDWMQRTQRYVIEASTDGADWTPLADASGSDRSGWDDWAVADQTIRYLRLTAVTNSGGTQVVVAELEVYGTRAPVRRSVAAPAAPASGSVVEESEPVAVLTSAGPEDETGWNAVDGDDATAWVGQSAGGGYLVVEYQPTLALAGLEVDVTAASLAAAQVLTSLDGQTWQPLPDDLEENPVSLNFLWLVFPDDGSGAAPEVIEIRPNP
ncbi:MAG: discoidin domain-containing protein [Kiritimatiellia bacterium]